MKIVRKKLIYAKIWSLLVVKTRICYSKTTQDVKGGSVYHKTALALWDAQRDWIRYLVGALFFFATLVALTPVTGWPPL